jgi:predicted Zn-dependent protease
MKFHRCLCKCVLLMLLLTVCENILCFAAEAQKKKYKNSDEELAASIKRERAIGDKIAEEIAKNMDFVEDPFITARVRGIFNRLVPGVKRPLPYNVHIVREKSPNAFCIPGGNIYVTTGLIDFVRSDAELAFVMAHELCHADGKHGIIQMERNQKISLVALAIAIASRGAGAAMVLSNAAAIAISNAYSRDLEQEADIGAVDVAEKAGYDLVAGVTVMESLAAEELKQPWIDPGYTGDHPKIADRIQYISELVERKGYQIHRKTVLKLLRPVITEDNGTLVFKVDETEILRGKATPALKQYCQNASEVINASLQMETPVYDIRLTKWNGTDAVNIGVVRLMAAPVPGSDISMKEVRQNLVNALGESHKKHPMANYNL